MRETEIDQRLSRIETGIANLTSLIGARFDLLDRNLNPWTLRVLDLENRIKILERQAAEGETL